MKRKIWELLRVALVLSVMSVSVAFTTYAYRSELECALDQTRPPIILVETILLKEEFDHTEFVGIFADGRVENVESADVKADGLLWVIELQFCWGEGYVRTSVSIPVGDAMMGVTIEVAGCSKYRTVLHDRRPPEKEDGF